MIGLKSAYLAAVVFCCAFSQAAEEPTAATRHDAILASLPTEVGSHIDLTLTNIVRQYTDNEVTSNRVVLQDVTLRVTSHTATETILAATSFNLRSFTHPHVVEHLSALGLNESATTEFIFDREMRPTGVRDWDVLASQTKDLMYAITGIEPAEFDTLAETPEAKAMFERVFSRECLEYELLGDEMTLLDVYGLSFTLEEGPQTDASIHLAVRLPAKETRHIKKLDATAGQAIVTRTLVINPEAAKPIWQQFLRDMAGNRLFIITSLEDVLITQEGRYTLDLKTHWVTHCEHTTTVTSGREKQVFIRRWSRRTTDRPAR